MKIGDLYEIRKNERSEFKLVPKPILIEKQKNAKKWFNFWKVKK